MYGKTARFRATNQSRQSHRHKQIACEYCQIAQDRSSKCSYEITYAYDIYKLRRWNICSILTKKTIQEMRVNHMLHDLIYIYIYITLKYGSSTECYRQNITVEQGTLHPRSHIMYNEKLSCTYSTKLSFLQRAHQKGHHLK